jgi:hypothetical protein
MTEKTNFKFGRENQTVKPSWAQEKKSEQKTQIFYGAKDGGSKHGHTVIKDNKIEYARTAEGHVKYDSKK